MKNCTKCENKLKSFKYNLFQVCEKCGSIFIEDKFIGTLSDCNDIKNLSFCYCGSKAIKVLEKEDFPTVRWVCLNCGRIHTVDLRVMWKFIYPDINSDKGFQDEISIHNSCMAINSEQTKIIGRPYYMDIIPFDKAMKEDSNFVSHILKGYAVYEEDEFHLRTGVKYIPININTGEILYNKVKGLIRCEI